MDFQPAHPSFLPACLSKSKRTLLLPSFISITMMKNAGLAVLSTLAGNQERHLCSLEEQQQSLTTCVKHPKIESLVFILDSSFI